MFSPKFSALLEEYHRKKWFPKKYPDPFGEFIDYVSESFLREAVETGDIGAATYVFRIYPRVRFSDLFAEYRSAFSEQISEHKVSPEFVLYFLRVLPEPSASELWAALQDWCKKWKNALHDWHQARISWEMQWPFLQGAFLPPDTTGAIHKMLLDSRELFAWRWKNKTGGSSYLLEAVRHLNYPAWKAAADWNDLPALSRAVTTLFGIKNAPKLQKSLVSAAVQYLFPISPPRRIALEYGNAEGPLDAFRFLLELGQGFFYCGINPELDAQSRICGDPSLPLFWGYIFAGLLCERAGVCTVLKPQLENLAEDMQLGSEFFYRYDASLALYRNGIDADLKEAQDLYVHCFEKSFDFEAPHFLYLYDLDRANEASYRTFAQSAAAIVRIRLQELYGTRWFAAPKLSRRFRDYWHEGFRLSLMDILQDLGADVKRIFEPLIS